MSVRTKIGIIGTGRMGALHLSKFKNLPEVEFVGVYEPSIQRAAEISKSMDVKTFSSLEELMFLSEGVVIASPTPTHFSLAKFAMESGCHVLIEKPLCERVDEALELEKLAQEKGLVCQAGFLERYRLNAMISGDTLQSHPRLEFQRLSTAVGREPAVDVVSDLMVHDIDLVMSIWKDEPTHIYAEGFSVVTDYIDFAKAELIFPGGKTAHLTASRISPRVTRTLKVINQNYYKEFDFVTNTKFLVTNRTKAEAMPQPIIFDALEVQAQSFVRAIQSSVTPLITAGQGAKVIEVTEKIRETILGYQSQTTKLKPADSSLLLREH